MILFSMNNLVVLFASFHLLLRVHLEIQFKPKTKSPTLLSSIFTPIYLLSLFVLSIAQLRLNIFIGSLNQVLNNLTGNDEEQGM